MKYFYKELITTTGALLIITGVVYLIFSFCAVSFKVFEWHWAVRSLFAVIEGAFIAVAIAQFRSKA